jgi:hypothetical protein
VAAAYSSTPFAFNTQYFLLNDGRALTIEGYAIPTGERLSVTGGIAGFSGAAGDVEEGPFGNECHRMSGTFEPSLLSSPALCAVLTERLA